ncbi:unnamed protein product [Miscanthus lutarioriparius]|uniref:Sulfotransferase n=1 Tax=Miscanthus lutarioriparius TaxID=422564 RepID=A0A811P8D2_9POAL|nr:unnamed protein product [Miscanthus lutarioriparius]
MILYKNYWFRPSIIESILRAQNSFKPRPEDTIIAAYLKCGTTWLKALFFAVTNRSQYDFDHHPLLFRHPQEVLPFIEAPIQGNLTYLETLPSPRLLSTHMSLSLLPKSTVSSGCRIVYMCRDPKDAFVSWWYFYNKVHIGYHIDLETAFNMFSEGFSDHGPCWGHYLEYWRESIARSDKVLFLKYEDMILEPIKHVIRLALFLGAPFSIREEEDGVPEQLVRLCSFEKLSSLPENQTGRFTMLANTVIEKSWYFRKGMVGDWANHISMEMGRKLDCIVEEKLKGSGLVL